jgi:hypothetical protein
LNYELDWTNHAADRPFTIVVAGASLVRVVRFCLGKFI